MPNTVILSSLAEKELQESFDWYEEQRAGLGERLLDQIEASITAIGNNPSLFPVKVGSYRQYVVSTFPFVIVYEYRAGEQRSEEHTSELQSLMRHTYAVFSSKKKKIYS